MTARPVPTRHWRTYGNNYPLPTGADALDEPFAAFPSWFMRVTCDRCGHERMFSEVHSAQRAMPIRDILDRMHHDGCGGRAGKAELLSGIGRAEAQPACFRRRTAGWMSTPLVAKGERTGADNACES